MHASPTEALPIRHPLPQKILVGVVAIDRDHVHVDTVFTSIEEALSGRCDWQIMVVTREQDHVARSKWEAKGARVATVPNYSITDRHNVPKIAEKRNVVREYGRDHGFDAIFFVDSDILLTGEIVDDLLNCSRYADVVIAPYLIRWSGRYTVGMLVGERRVELPDARELMARERYPIVHGGPMGCTLIRRSALGVAFVPMWIGNVQGEDIGFFATLHRTRPDLVVRTTSWPHVATHII